MSVHLPWNSLLVQLGHRVCDRPVIPEASDMMSKVLMLGRNTQNTHFLKMRSWAKQSFTEKSEVGIWQTATYIYAPNNQHTVWIFFNQRTMCAPGKAYAVDRRCSLGNQTETVRKVVQKKKQRCLLDRWVGFRFDIIISPVHAKNSAN